MPTAPPRHGQARVEQNRLANQREYNRKRRTGQDFYNSKEWRKARNYHIRNNPVCVDCLKVDVVKGADVVDHIKPIREGGDKLSSDNLQSLCHYHHNRKTAREKKGGEVFVVYGPPCAGKTSYVDGRANKGDIRVDFDQLAEAFGIDRAATDDLKNIVVSARYAAIKKILGGVSATAWIIDTNPSPKMIQYYRESGVTFHELNPGIDVCLALAKHRPDGTEKRIRQWFANEPKIKDFETAGGKVSKTTGGNPATRIRIT